MPMLGYTYDDVSGTLVPNPARVKPKPGHWRKSPRGRHIMAPIKRAEPFAPSNMRGVATDLRSKRRPTRAELRAMIAAGVLPPSAMPSRAGK